MQYHKFLLICIGQKYYDNAIKENHWYLKYVPPQFQTLEMCEDVIKKDAITFNRYDMLQYCHYVNETMLKTIQDLPCFYNVPRKNRFDFIKGYDISLLEKISLVRPNLKKYITDK